MIEDISSAVIGFIVIVAIVFLLRMIGLLFKGFGKKKKDTPWTPQRKAPSWTLQRKIAPRLPERKITPPTYHDSSQPPTIPDWIISEEEFDYQTEEWKRLSKRYRNQKNWTCEMCGLNLKSDTYFLDTHHTQGTDYNDPKYLKALCIGCHAEQREGQHQKLMFYDDLRYKKRYQEFINRYGRQWQMRFINEVLRPPEE